MSGQTSGQDRASRFESRRSTIDRVDTDRARVSLGGWLRLIPPIAFAVLLILAAFAKLNDLNIARHFSKSLDGGPWSQSPLLTITLTLCEVFLAICLIVGVARSYLRIACIIILSIFVGYSALSVLQGAESCGCFGSAKISPWVTGTLDILLLASFVAVRPRYLGEVWPARARAAICGSLALTLAFFFLLIFGRPVVTAHDAPSQTIAPGSNVILDPDEWTGRPLPLFRDFQVGGSSKSSAELAAERARLGTGRWNAILVHAGCPDCKNALMNLPDRAATWGVPNDNPLAIIELPPFGNKSWKARFGRSGDMHLRLRSDVKWFAPTPTLVVLEDGVVKKVILPRQIGL